MPSDVLIKMLEERNCYIDYRERRTWLPIISPRLAPMISLVRKILKKTCDFMCKCKCKCQFTRILTQKFQNSREPCIVECRPFSKKHQVQEVLPLRSIIQEPLANVLGYSLTDSADWYHPVPSFIQFSDHTSDKYGMTALVPLVFPLGHKSSFRCFDGVGQKACFKSPHVTFLGPVLP